MQGTSFCVVRVAGNSLATAVLGGSTNRLPRASVVECDERLELFRLSSALDIIRIHDDIGDTDALKPVDAFIVDEPHLIAVGVLETLDEERSVGITDE
jgi:hypothetical protein